MGFLINLLLVGVLVREPPYRLIKEKSIIQRRMRRKATGGTHHGD
jgi:hypothetical protein